MSGSSTLRLVCLAAMAPALTEAASSTRLKLQDPSTKEISIPVKIDQDLNRSHYISQHKEQSDPGSGLFSESRGHIDNRLVHLSIRNGKDCNQGEFSRPPPTVVSGLGGKGVGLTLTSASPCIVSKPALSGPRLKDLNFKLNHKNSKDLKDKTIISFAISKDSPHISKSDIIDSLRRVRMNKTQLIAGKNNGVVSGNNHQIHSDLKSKGIEKITFVKHSGMVNGTYVLKAGEKKPDDSELSVDCCNESGDAPANKSDTELHLISNPVKLKSNSVLLTNTKLKNMCWKDNIVGSPIELGPMANKTESGKSCDELRRDCGKKQVLLEKRVDALLRRLKRIKSKVVETHTKEQLVQYVNFQHRNLQMVAKTIKNEAPGPEELKEHFLSNEEVKNMSTSQLVKLVRGYKGSKPLFSNDTQSRFRSPTNASIMSTSVANHCLHIAERLHSKVQATEGDLDSDATASSSGGESGDEDSVSLPLNPDVKIPPIYRRAEWKWAVERAAVVNRWTWLQAQVSDLEYKIRQQSQVHRQLKNSKGGVVLGDPPTPNDILRRLQGLPTRPTGSSSSTTEAKTATGNDSTASCEVSPCNVSALLSNVDKQASRLTQSLHCISPASSTIGSPLGSKLSSPLVNGASDSPSSNTTTEAETTAENSPLISTSLSNLRQHTSSSLDHNLTHATPDASCQAARCRPLRSYRKRKILRTVGLYKTSIKAARLSDIHCHCYPPASSCPICGGRYNNTITMDPDGLSFSEKVALSDPSFHPVLSFPQDVQLSIHCEGLLKSGLWQNKPPPKRSRVGEYRKQKVLTLVSEPVRKNGNKIPVVKISTAPSVINFSTKIKNKYEGKTKVKNNISKPPPLKPKANPNNKVKRKAAKLARAALKKKQEKEDELEELFFEQEGGMPSNSRDHLSHSGSAASLKDLRDSSSGSQRKRKVDDSYDINNIVIPHSIAASTRVEQLQYKEIVTPKWREVENISLGEIGKKLVKTNGVSLEVEQHQLNSEDEFEDLTDEKYASRHDKPEQEEKKRFRNFLQYPPIRRNRARSDFFGPGSDKEASVSKMDVQESQSKGDNTADEKNTEESSSLLHKSLPSSMFSSLDDSMDGTISAGRRKTISSFRRDRSGSGMEEAHSLSFELNNIEPWPRRIFPLSEDELLQMQSDAPSNCEPVHQRLTRRLAEPSGKVYVGCSSDHEGSQSRVESRAASPFPSNESISSAGDDPNDPEWLSSSSDTGRRIRERRVFDDVDPDWTVSGSYKKSKKR